MISIFKIACQTLWQILARLLFPPTCFNCQKVENFLCHNCYHGVNFIFQPPTIEELTKSLPTVYFDQVLILAKLQTPLSLLIKALKYQHAKNVGIFLGKMLYQHLNLPDSDYLTFIPLHPVKYRQRGYNQAQVLAKTLADLTHIPLLDCLARPNNLSAQAQVKNRQERLARVEHLFVIKPHMSKTLINKRLILIDDIFTTGATVNAAAKTLKMAGVNKVTVVAVASKKDC